MDVYITMGVRWGFQDGCVHSYECTTLNATPFLCYVVFPYILTSMNVVNCALLMKPSLPLTQHLSNLIQN